MPIDQEFVDYLSKTGYHPRSSAHSDFLSEIIIRDLVQMCPKLGERAAKGEVLAQLRHHQTVNHDDWVIDIAIGSCADKPVVPVNACIRKGPPAMIQIAIELKSIMTEHGKARRNRLRDFQAFHNYAHQYDPKTVAGAFLVVNSSALFYSPLRKPSDITRHGADIKKARQTGTDAVDLFRTISLRHREGDGPGLEAMGVVVVEHDNLNVHPQKKKVSPLAHPTQIAPVPPNLNVGDPLHYSTFMQRICQAYSQRF